MSEPGSLKVVWEVQFPLRTDRMHLTIVSEPPTEVCGDIENGCVWCSCHVHPETEEQ